MGCHCLLQGIFLTQGSSPGLLLSQQIFYHWGTWEAQVKYYWNILFPFLHLHNSLSCNERIVPWIISKTSTQGPWFLHVRCRNYGKIRQLSSLTVALSPCLFPVGRSSSVHRSPEDALDWASRLCSDKESACQCRRRGFDPWLGKILWSRKWEPTPVFLPGESHGQKSLVGYSPRGSKELDTAEHTHTPPRLLTSSWQGNLQTDIGILLNKSSNT